MQLFSFSKGARGLQNANSEEKCQSSIFKFAVSTLEFFNFSILNSPFSVCEFAV